MPRLQRARRLCSASDPEDGPHIRGGANVFGRAAVVWWGQRVGWLHTGTALLHRQASSAVSEQFAGEGVSGNAAARLASFSRFASLSVGEGVRGLLDAIKTSGGPDLSGLKLPSLPLPLWVAVTPSGAHPSKNRLMTVQDFFRYTSTEGRRFFDELDRDGDGRVTLADVKAALRKRNLPDSYATDLMNRVRRNRWWLSSFGWEDFKSFVDEREAHMLNAFTTLELAPDGHVELNGIKRTLRKAELPATDENAIAMLSALGTSPEGLVTYGKFRNFLILLPDKHLQDEMDPAVAWFESATMVPVTYPIDERSSAKVVFTAALAGALASGSTTFTLHPLDTLKTRLQASKGASTTLRTVVASIPEIGAVGLYRGIIPATVGSAASHGVRTGVFELTFRLIKAVSGGALELQATGLASGVGTLMGTAFRIPCEVLKQRLQVGAHGNVGEALVVATRESGVQGLFRGTVATMAREVPFYVFGMMGYQSLKKLFSGEMLGGPGCKRELSSSETIATGALAGAVASILTTPADVMKTRIMTLPAGQKFEIGKMVIEVAQREGFGAFFKGAVPRMFWIAPLGAMNFAGYELAKNAMLDDKKGSGAEGGAQEVGPSSTGAPAPSTTKAEAGERKAAATAERRGQRDGKEEEQDGRGGGGVSTAPFRAISEHSTDSSSPVHYDNKYGIADAALSEQWEPEKTEGNGRVVVGPPPPKG